MRYTTVAQALTAIAKGYAESNPDTLLGVLNDVRQELYSMYSSVSQFATVQECFEVQTFCTECSGGDHYRGVTLPRGYAATEAIWFDRRSVKMFDRWREWQDGMTSPCDCGLSKYEVGDFFPCERDISSPSKLVFLAQSSEDNLKSFTIHGKTVTGYAEEKFELSDAAQTTKSVWVSIERIVKDRTAGNVVLAQEGGRKLSIYAPDEIVPAYKRIKITGLPNDCAYVNIRAARDFMPVIDDSDVVETGNLRVWELMARYLRIDRKDGRTREDILSGEKFKADARSLLLGDVSRDKGKSTTTSLRVPSPAIRSIRRRW